LRECAVGKSLLLSIIPIFVAVDAFGVLPIFVSFTVDLEVPQRRAVVLQSTLTAVSLSLGFVFVGRVVFRLLGITMADFMIAGGIILLCLAVLDIVTTEKERRKPSGGVGIVPLGTPLIAGPAVLTASLIVADQHGLIAAIVSVVINIVFAALVFLSSGVIIRVVGITGTKALSKVTSLFLAAIAIMMIRRGVLLLIA